MARCGFVLTSPSMTGLEMADLLVGHLGRIERLARSDRAPFIATVTRSAALAIPVPVVRFPPQAPGLPSPNIVARQAPPGGPFDFRGSGRLPPHRSLTNASA